MSRYTHRAECCFTFSQNEAESLKHALLLRLPGWHVSYGDTDGFNDNQTTRMFVIAFSYSSIGEVPADWYEQAKRALAESLSKGFAFALTKIEERSEMIRT